MMTITKAEHSFNTMYLNHLILITILIKCDYPHFTNQETEPQRLETAHLRQVTGQWQSQDLDPSGLALGFGFLNIMLFCLSQTASWYS